MKTKIIIENQSGGENMKTMKNKNQTIKNEAKSMKNDSMLSGLNCEELCLLSNKKELGKVRTDRVKELAEEEMAQNVCEPCW